MFVYIGIVQSSPGGWEFILDYLTLPMIRSSFPNILFSKQKQIPKARPPQIRLVLLRSYDAFGL